MRKSLYGALAGGLATLAMVGSAAAAGGMPQLDVHDFAPQLVWLAIAFVILYFVMSRLAVPAIADTLAKRQAKIQGDLDAAEKANEETRALVAAYEKRLADAREEARRLTREQGEADGAVATARFKRAARSPRQADRRSRATHRPATRRRHGRARAYGKRHRPDVYAKLAGQPADHGALAGKITAAIKGDGR